MVGVLVCEVAVVTCDPHVVDALTWLVSMTVRARILVPIFFIPMRMASLSSSRLPFVVSRVNDMIQ
jgi:hypothetical protein